MEVVQPPLDVLKNIQDVWSLQALPSGLCKVTYLDAGALYLSFSYSS
jgi:hypothetical protein